MNFPPISVLNKYHIGDTVLLEPIARRLSEVYSGNVFICSRHGEVLKYHPNINTLLIGEEMPENIRAIDLSEAINFTPGERLGMMQDSEPGKLQRMYEGVGLDLSVITKPKLYLSHSEETKARELASLFNGVNIGVVLSSRFSVKNWIHTRLLIKQLVKAKYNVFVFSEGIGLEESRIIKAQNVYKVADKDLREAMVWLSIMDVVVGPDTGLMHISGALDVPTVVLVWNNFQDLYEAYNDCIVLPAGKRGLGAISVRKAITAIKKLLGARTKEDSPAVLVARCRGIGDILMTLPALTTLRANDGIAAYTYLTSQAGAKLLRGARSVDTAIGVDYDHASSGFPRLPDDVDCDKYSSVHNLINRVDFARESASMKRTEMFAELLDVEIDYSLDWKLHPLYSWRKNAKRKLHKAGLDYGEPFMAMQTTAAGWSRIWPKERWKEFVDLAIDAGHTVVLLSDKIDDDVPELAINLTGQLNVEEYAGVIAESQIFIGPDSSGIHLAGSMDVPAIGLFGSVDPKLRIAHYDTVTPIIGKGKCVPCNDSQQSSCRNDPHAPVCIWNIEPLDILKCSEKILQKRGG